MQIGMKQGSELRPILAVDGTNHVFDDLVHTEPDSE
jgi:hypothetical protein